jgi:chemotaxis signal transduction protein
MDLHSINKNSGEAVAVEERQFVTFIIGEELYGVDVTRVQEIIGMTQITCRTWSRL